MNKRERIHSLIDRVNEHRAKVNLPLVPLNLFSSTDDEEKCNPPNSPPQEIADGMSPADLKLWRRLERRRRKLEKQPLDRDSQKTLMMELEAELLVSFGVNMSVCDKQVSDEPGKHDE